MRFDQDNPDDIAGAYDIAAFGSVVDVRAFLRDCKFPINLVCFSGETLLGISVRYTNLEVARLLLSIGCDANLYDADQGGEPPIKLAVENSRWDLFGLLIDAGAELDSPGWMGISARDILAGKMGSNPSDELPSRAPASGKGSPSGKGEPPNNGGFPPR